MDGTAEAWHDGFWLSFCPPFGRTEGRHSEKRNHQRDCDNRQQSGEHNGACQLVRRKSVLSGTHQRKISAGNSEQKSGGAQKKRFCDKQLQDKQEADGQQDHPQDYKQTGSAMAENFPQGNPGNGNAQHQHGEEGRRASRIGDRVGNDHGEVKIHKIKQNRQQRGKRSDVNDPGQEGFYTGLSGRRSICSGLFFDDRNTCGVKQQIIDNAVDGNIDQRAAAQHCRNQGNAKKAHVAVHGQKVIHIAVFFWNPHDDRKQQAGRKKQDVNADRDEKSIEHVSDGYGGFLFKSGAENGRRIADIDYQPGYVAGGLVAQFSFLEHEIADQDEDEHDAHLSDHDCNIHEYLQIEVLSD